NPNTKPITVTGLQVTVAPGSTKAGCDGPTNLQVTQSNASSSNIFTVPAKGADEEPGDQPGRVQGRLLHVQLQRKRALMRRRSNSPIRRRAIVLTVPAVLGLSVGAFAFWSGQGSGTASGSVGTLAAPSITKATPGAGTVELSWTVVTPPASGEVTYYVSRDGGSAAGNCPSSASRGAQTSCTDSGLSVGAHEYTVTAVWRSWTAKSAGKSVEVASNLTVTSTSPS